jgi:hypothetical protein
MKMPPDLVKAQGNMAPGVITADGFLGSDKRPLVDIIEADEEKMRTLGLDFQEVSEKMDRLLKEGRRWLVRTDEARGFLPCPFEDGVFRKVTATVVHRATGQKLVYSDLSLHLLDKHHFLQGYGAAFRIEPAAVGKVLEL